MDRRIQGPPGSEWGSHLVRGGTGGAPARSLAFRQKRDPRPRLKKGEDDAYIPRSAEVLPGGQVRLEGVGFSMGPGHEAYDAELTAIAYDLLILSRRGETGQDFTLFTDSKVAMTRMENDAPGPGQDIAIGAIEPAWRLVDQGNTVTLRWTPAHSGRKRTAGLTSEGGGGSPPPEEHPTTITQCMRVSR